MQGSANVIRLGRLGYCGDDRLGGALPQLQQACFIGFHFYHYHPVILTDTMAPVSTQPLSSSMSAHSVELCNGEKSANQCHFHLASKGQCACAADSTSARQRACHTRLRKLLFPIALFLLAVGGTLVISCVYDIDLFDLVNLGADMSGSPLGKRQSVTNGQSTFTRQKREFISRYTVHVCCDVD